MIGHDHDAVVLARLEGNRAHRESVVVELGHVRIVVGDLGAGVLEQPISLMAGDSRMSEMSGL